MFVFGLPRSGTTLVAQLLGAHPRVFSAGELPAALHSFQAIAQVLGSHLSPLECAAQLDRPALEVLAQRHLAELHEFDDGRSERFVDKGPANYQFLGLLAAMFPHAVFIHCRRDLRDVAVSCWLTDFEEARWANDPAHIGAYFRQYLRLMQHWGAVLPTDVHEVHYEETVGDTEGIARRLLAACELDWDPGCLEFHRSRGLVQTSSAAQVRQPIYTRSVGRWRHYEHELADLLAALPASP